MSTWKAPLALCMVLVLATSACCCPFGDLTGLVGGAEFTTGDFADVPAYPGSSQSTESNTALSAMTMVFSFISDEVEWKQYTTSDSEDDIISWYEDTLPDYGWVSATDEDLGADVDLDEGLIFIKVADPDTLLVVLPMPDVEGGSDTYILIGRIRVKEGEE